MKRTRRETVYPAPRAAIELVAIGLTASEAVEVVAALPAFASNLGRSVYLDRVMWSHGRETSLGWANEWLSQHGFNADAPKATGAVGGVRYVL